jgi:hypothetical protein
MVDFGHGPRAPLPSVSLALAAAGLSPTPAELLTTTPVSERVPGIGMHTWYTNRDRSAYAELLRIVHRPDFSRLRWQRRRPFVVHNANRHCLWCAEAWPCTAESWAAGVTGPGDVRIIR